MFIVLNNCINQNLKRNSYTCVVESTQRRDLSGGEAPLTEREGGHFPADLWGSLCWSKFQLWLSFTVEKGDKNVF